MELKVLCPNSHFPEREYILRELLERQLGLDVAIAPDSGIQCTEIRLENGNSIRFSDVFFAFVGPLYTEERIPERTQEIVYKGENMVCIFGKPEIKRVGNTIECGLDIPASAFFMLTRWEEMALAVRDNHDRFPASASLAYKGGFIDRPVVDEYVQFLKNGLQELGYTGKFTERKFAVIPTCDMDHLRLWHSKLSGMTTVLGSFNKSRPFLRCLHNFRMWMKYLRDACDPYDTFDAMMETAKRHSSCIHFFALVGGSTPFDTPIDVKHVFFQNLVQRIKNKGHTIGLHPSYDTVGKPELFAREKQALEIAARNDISSGRHHYLRFKVPDTWGMWDAQGMVWDSTMGYPEVPGFRCGICKPFQVFDVKERKPLKLMERPLIAMDVTLVLYQKLSPTATLNTLRQLLQTVKKHRGEFVFLWHNSSFNTFEWRDYHTVFESVLAENLN